MEKGARRLETTNSSQYQSGNSKNWLNYYYINLLQKGQQFFMKKSIKIFWSMLGEKNA